jgi:SlyX protein
MVSDRLEARLTELETRVAFQELAISELSDALAAARIETARHADQLRRALEQLKQQGGEPFADPAEEPPPPHY